MENGNAKGEDVKTILRIIVIVNNNNNNINDNNNNINDNNNNINNNNNNINDINKDRKSSCRSMMLSLSLFKLQNRSNYINVTPLLEDLDALTRNICNNIFLYVLVYSYCYKFNI